jgi:hypothetical protein
MKCEDVSSVFVLPSSGCSEKNMLFGKSELMLDGAPFCVGPHHCFRCSSVPSVCYQVDWCDFSSRGINGSKPTIEDYAEALKCTFCYLGAPTVLVFLQMAHCS